MSRTDYQMTTQKGRKLFLNVCQPVKTETFGLKDDAVAPSEIGAFIRRDHGDFSIGLAIILFPPLKNPTSSLTSMNLGNSTIP